MYKGLRDSIEELKAVETVKEYETFLQRLIEKLRKEKYGEDVVQLVRCKGTYLSNEFSDIAEKKSMIRARENLVFLLESLSAKEQEEDTDYSSRPLEKYLEHFYGFLEALTEIKLDKRATLAKENLEKIKIENEYDLQHLLYAVLKPLYEDIRKEVTEDSGVGTVRSDMWIPTLQAVIETKCTRKSMTIKKLTEELEADIIHYRAKTLYFYIFDKEKLVLDRSGFEHYFNRKFDGKEVKIFLLQPVKM